MNLQLLERSSGDMLEFRRHVINLSLYRDWKKPQLARQKLR
jgi:hypothetical protein